jgi:hypothetical protein
MVSALKNYRVVFGILSQFKSSCTKVGEKLNKVVEGVFFQMGVSPVYLMSEYTDFNILLTEVLHIRTLIDL